MNEWIQIVLLILFGQGAGFFVAAGAMTVVAVVGVIPRYINRTKTASKISCYENILLAGTFFGNLLGLYQQTLMKTEWVSRMLQLFWNTPVLPQMFVIIYGISTGVFVGCLAIAIEEITQAIPIFSRKAKMLTKQGIGILLIAIAVGKFAGSFVYFFIPGFLK